VEPPPLAQRDRRNGPRRRHAGCADRLVDTPLFGRAVPPTWWSWPASPVSAGLSGLLIATYVRAPAFQGTPTRRRIDGGRRSRRWGGAGGMLTFAVDCPVCSKLLLLALGAGGAMTYFEPVQPALSVLALRSSAGPWPAG
jgi:hypothetical protein